MVLSPTTSKPPQLPHESPPSVALNNDDMHTAFPHQKARKSNHLKYSTSMLYQLDCISSDDCENQHVGIGDSLYKSRLEDVVKERMRLVRAHPNSLLHVVHHVCLYARLKTCKSSRCSVLKDKLKPFMPSCNSWPSLKLWILQLAACLCGQKGTGHNLADVAVATTEHLFKLSPAFAKAGQRPGHKYWVTVSSTLPLSQALSSFAWLYGIATGNHIAVPEHNTDQAICDAFARASEQRLCPNRIWAVSAALPGNERNIPLLVPHNPTIPTPDTDSHKFCTSSFCERSVVNSTLVPQLHKCSGGTCDIKRSFQTEPIVSALTGGTPTAWHTGGERLVTKQEKFIAISHVWADGTGAGIGTIKHVNICLYEYFCDMARSLGAEGIWWDVICLPDGANRSRALSKMHLNYQRAACTVVHDRYLLDIPWTDGDSAAFALVMSPWFARGWTALELLNAQTVKVLFANNVLKDLDEDILLGPGEPCSQSFQVARSHLRVLRRRGVPIDSLNALLIAMAPRFTSWPRDRAIISGLLAGVETRHSTLHEIYREILIRVGKVHHSHLFHGAATTMGGISWCPSNLFSIPVVSDPHVALLQVNDNGDLSGKWKCEYNPNIQGMLGVFSGINRHANPISAARVSKSCAALSSDQQCRQSSNQNHYIILVDLTTIQPRQGLAVRVLKKPLDHVPSTSQIYCEFIGPLDLPCKYSPGGLDVIDVCITERQLEGLSHDISAREYIELELCAS